MNQTPCGAPRTRNLSARLAARGALLATGWRPIGALLEDARAPQTRAQRARFVAVRLDNFGLIVGEPAEHGTEERVAPSRLHEGARIG